MNTAICSDCSSVRVGSSPYCNFCKNVRDQHSRPCSTCPAGIIGPEVDDFVEICSTCSTPKYKCSTAGCEAQLDQHWKKTCDKCFREQRLHGTPIKTNPSKIGSETETKTCLTCPAVVLQSWQKYCMSCFKTAASNEPSTREVATTAGETKTCLTCPAVVLQSWQKYCISCFKTTASNEPSVGEYKCTTSGCDATFPEKWKKKCLACYKMSK